MFLHFFVGFFSKIKKKAILKNDILNALTTYSLQPEKPFLMLKIGANRLTEIVYS